MNLEMPKSSKDTKWHRRDPDDSIWIDFDNALVVFHRPSGRTHLLNQAAGDILELLRHRALAAEDVALELRADGEEIPLVDFVSRVDSILRRLEDLGFLTSN